MGWRDLNKNMADDGLQFDRLDILIEEGTIVQNSKEHGIVLQMIQEGYYSLSKKQKFIYKKSVRQRMEELSKACIHCDEDFLYKSVAEVHLCAKCQHALHKD